MNLSKPRIQEKHNYVESAERVYKIAERISARHWIADCGPEIGRYMYVCMYVHHAFGMQLRISACVMATLFVPQICMHIPLLKGGESPAIVRGLRLRNENRQLSRGSGGMVPEENLEFLISRECF